MLATFYRRRRIWEVARRWAPALQAAPLATAAAEVLPTCGLVAGRRNDGITDGVQRDEVKQLRSMISKYKPYKRGGKRPGRGGGSASPHRSLAPVAIEEASLAPPRLSPTARRSILVLPVLTKARGRQRERLVWQRKKKEPAVPKSARLLNKNICSQFDRLMSKLVSGRLTRTDKLTEAQKCLDEVAKALPHAECDVNVSTFLHRISKLVVRSEMADVRSQLDLSTTMPVLLQRFEELVESALQEAKQGVWEVGGAAEEGSSRAQGIGAASSTAQGALVEGDSAAGAAPSSTTLSCRSLSAGFWALGYMRYPLTQQQLDNFSRAILLRSEGLTPEQISMLLLGLNAYRSTPYVDSLQRYLMKLVTQYNVKEFVKEGGVARVLSSLVDVVKAGATVNQEVIDHLSMVALASLPGLNHLDLGSLAWSLGNLVGRPAAQFLHPAVPRALAATAWRRLHELPPPAFSNMLHGLGLLNYHPGIEFMDAAAARLKELLPDMNAQQVSNCLWAFHRLEYSPNPDRWTWAVSSSINRVPVRQGDGSSTLKGAGALGGGWAGSAAAESEEVEEEEEYADKARRFEQSARHRQQQAVRGQELKNAALHIKVQAQIAEKREFAKLMAHVQQAVTVALARARRAKGKASKQLQAEQPQRMAVSEKLFGDMVHYICTGSIPSGRLTRYPPTSDMCGMEQRLDRRTGITHFTPYYTRGQLFAARPPHLWPIWRQSRQLEEAAAAEEAAEEDEGAGEGRGCQEPAGLKGGPLLPRTPAGSRQQEVEPQWGEAPEHHKRQWDEAEQQRRQNEQQRQASAAAVAAAVAGGELESLAAFLQGGNGLEQAQAADASNATDGGAEARGQEVGDVGDAGDAEEDELPFDAPAPDFDLDSSGEETGDEEEEGEEKEGEDEQLAVGAPQRQQQRRQRGRGRRERQLDTKRQRQEELQKILDLPPAELMQRLLADTRLFSVPGSVKQMWEGLDRATLDDAAEHVIPLARGMGGVEIGSLMCSYAIQRHVHPALFEALLARVKEILDRMPCRTISNIIWACATTRHAPSPELAHRLVQRYISLYRQQQKRVQSDDNFAPSNTAWSLAVFDYLTPETFRMLTDLVPAQDPTALQTISTAGFCQFFQSALYLEAKTGRHYTEFLPAHILPQAEAHWQARETTTSRLQNKVADVLHSLGVPFAEEYSPRANFFSIDIAIQTKGVRLAVEVDGPQHFSSNPPHMPLASTHLRDQLLKMNGWQVVSIPFNEWAQLNGEKQQQDYLKQHVLSKLGQ